MQRVHIKMSFNYPKYIKLRFIFQIDLKSMCQMDVCRRYRTFQRERDTEVVMARSLLTQGTPHITQSLWLWEQTSQLRSICLRLVGDDRDWLRQPRVTSSFSSHNNTRLYLTSDKFFYTEENNSIDMFGGILCLHCRMYLQPAPHPGYLHEIWLLKHLNFI